MGTLTSQRTDRGLKHGDTESWDPPQRISSLPPLATQDEQARFLCSPSAVVESLGLRIPAALARHIRRSDPPPPPATMRPGAPVDDGLEPVTAKIRAELPDVPEPVVEMAPELPPPAPVADKPKRSRSRKKR